MIICLLSFLCTGIIIADVDCCLSSEQVMVAYLLVVFRLNGKSVAYLFVVFLVNRYNYCLSVCCLSCEQVMVVVFLVNRDKCWLSVCCLSCEQAIAAYLFVVFLVNRQLLLICLLSSLWSDDCCLFVCYLSSVQG